MEAKFINPYTDFGFKKLFGEEASKDLLIDFLNTILPASDRIKELQLTNPENLPEYPDGRRAVFDIHCRNERGEAFIVEMQKAYQHYFKDRALFYSTFPLQRQAPQGSEWDFKLQKVYFVAVLDFLYDEAEERQKFLRHIHLKDQDGELFSDKLEFIFLQMPLFNKAENELENHKDQWLYFLKNLARFEDIPAILREPIFTRAFATANLAAMDRRERDVYDASLKIYRDNVNVIDSAYQKGVAQGIEQGVEQGIEQGIEQGEIKQQLAIAKNMKADGISSAQIARYTGLTESEIAAL
ncbi:hypothetical protein AGMMS49959_08100 [Planctomycetales bacterium]|nr:hypothetical protein AGMMS49959_08100 [Planctomycetales bacterium]